MTTRTYFSLFLSTCIISCYSLISCMQQQAPLVECTNCSIGTVQDPVVFSDTGRSALAYGQPKHLSHAVLREYDLITDKCTDHEVSETHVPPLSKREFIRLSNARVHYYNQQTKNELYTTSHKLCVTKQTVTLYDFYGAPKNISYTLPLPLDDHESIIAATDLGENRPVIVVTYPSQHIITAIDLLYNTRRDINVRDSSMLSATVKDMSVALHEESKSRATMAFVAHSNYSHQCFIQVATLHIVAKSNALNISLRNRQEPVTCTVESPSPQYADVRIGWDLEGKHLTWLTRFLCNTHLNNQQFCYHYVLHRSSISNFYPSSSAMHPFDFSITSAQQLPLNGAQIICPDTPAVIISPIVLEGLSLQHKRGPEKGHAPNTALHWHLESGKKNH